MLSAAERAEFDARGTVRLARAVESRRVADLRARVLDFVAARALMPESPEPGFAVTPSRTAPVVNALGFDEVWGSRVREAIDDLLDAGTWHVPTHAGQLLAMTAPIRGGTWRLPHEIWHLDYRAPHASRALPGLQVFLCVDEVAARAGGTVAVAGSARVVDAIRRRSAPGWIGSSSDVRKALCRELAWFRDLTSLRPGEDRLARFMTPSISEAAESLQVVELCGDAGDVFLMHPWTLHAPAANCGERPRMVLTERIHQR